MWLPTAIVEDVHKVARVAYYDVAFTKNWNDHRRPGELRLLTGWGWIAKDGSDARQGFKTMTVAYRDAWYCLVQKASIPSFVARPKLRVAASGASNKLAPKAPTKESPLPRSARQLRAVAA